VRLGVIAESALEWIALRLRRVPEPLVDTQLMFTMARTIMAAADRGVFRALASGPATADRVAEQCGTEPRATRQLLNSLAGIRYLTFDGERFALAERVRPWLDPDAPKDLHDKLAMQVGFEWDFVAHYERYLDSGEPLEMHEALQGDDWSTYQRGMLALARVSADEVARRTPVPRGARSLLDIGGAHGLYAAALCRRHAGLRAVVLDLPAAVERAAPLLAEHGLGDRLEHWAADALDADLGSERFDVVFTSQFAHHFDEAENRLLAVRVAQALRFGGVYVVQDFIRPETPADIRRMGAGALLDLYFGATSAAGTWSAEEIAGWQEAAGLRRRPPVWLRTLAGSAQVAAVKRRG
jgi:2-polyprenyl-3-methyl-5-hydroxy-6-metoxy-1,4-benzoquinol methylase